MKGLILNEINSEVQYKDFEPKIEGTELVKIDIKAAALNRRDYYITKGLYPKIKTPCILGSDASGIYNDKEVILNPNIDWGSNENYASKEYHILGMPTIGTFAECVYINEDRIHEKPAHLTFNEAAALPLAGMTAYRVLLKRCSLKPKEKVLITGIGGGVALMTMQFALAHQAEVYVTSSSDEKIEKAIQLGAKAGANYKDENWTKVFKDQKINFDIIIDSAGGKNFNALLQLLNFGGRLGFFGATAGNWSEVSPHLLFWKQISIIGSTMGSDKDFKEMLDYVKLHRIKPVIDSVFSLEEGFKAFRKMEQSNQFGKIVVSINQDS